ncbi:MAG TPA: DNA methyltransferase [Terriglobales bacterium]|nr:DNA methyltransferase [Terriglobales bacterium]
MRLRQTVSGHSLSYNYGEIVPITSPIPADRQGARRHYGVHPYFTRRPYNVVREYILHYSREGDSVLDPFGGSGVTAIEGFLENRTGIQNDINPLANFITESIVGLHKGTLAEYKQALDCVEARSREALHKIQDADEKTLAKLRDKVQLPPDIPLPANSDVSNFRELFSERQIISLAALKQAISRVPSKPGRAAMLLAWSACLPKLSKTFLSAEGRAESRGGSSIFSIYRYKIAKKPIELSPWETFEERARNVIAAKVEIDKHIEIKRKTGGWHGHFECWSRDVQELADELAGSVDYVFTDPPYGAHISYLDLSTLWNGWLGRLPASEARNRELIVGGDLGFSEDTYITRLGDAIRACFKMLRRNRWFSVVFQHWNVTYFEAILTSAADAGGELRAAVSQVGDPIWSMHKKKSNESVLAGELILTFFNSGRRTVPNRLNGFDVAEAVGEVLDSAESGQIYGEYLFNRIVMAAWQHGAIGSLNISKTEFIDLIQRNGWLYDEKGHRWVRERQPASLFHING